MHAALARTAPAAARLRWFLDRSLERLSRECPEALAVDLVGSLARGEGTVLFWGERPIVLSDLDLAVVFADVAARQRAAARLARLSRELAGEFAPWDFLGAVDAGAYALSDLPLQAARPGTLEWARAGVTVAGDAGCRHRLPAFDAAEIPREEALLLLENRMLELLWAHPSLVHSEPRLWAALYAGGKGVIDAALARLLAAGQCPGGVEERARAHGALLRGAPAVPTAESLAFWTEFKLAPERSLVAARYGSSASSRQWADAAWREGGEALLAVYRDLLLAARPTSDGAWLAHASGRARWRRRVRRAVEAWRAGRERRLSWGTLANLPRFASRGAPEHILGATAATLVAEALGENGSDRPPAGLPVVPHLVAPAGRESWETRRQQAVTAWDRWILRGARTPEAPS